MLAVRPDRRPVVRAVVRALPVGTVVACALVWASSAVASGTALFNQPFQDSTVDGTLGLVSVPTTPSGSNGVCLTVLGNSVKNPVASCATTPNDPQGSGTLRLTATTGNAEGGIV